MTGTFARVKGELEEWPEAATQEFEKAWQAMSVRLDEEQMARWADTGVVIARQTAHSWEAAALFYKVSPLVAETMPFNYFMKWAECGSGLGGESPALAVAYFGASPGAMGKLRSRHIEAWANLGRSLYKGTWKSSTLSSKFFESTPELLESLTFPELERFAAFLDLLSHHSYDLSAECLVLGQRLFPLVGQDKEAFLSLSITMVDSGWRQVKTFFEASHKALPRIEESQRMRFLKLSERLLSSGVVNIPNTMLEMSQALSEVEPGNHDRLLGIAAELLEASPVAVPELIKCGPDILDRISLTQMEQWCQEGMRILKQNKDGGLAYFKLESAYAEEVLESLSSGVEFARIKDVIEMYCRALAGSSVKLAVTSELVEKNIGWVSTEVASTEGSSVYLPPVVDRYRTKDENFQWFKVVSTHQVGHIEFGSFRFEFEAPPGLFKDLRHRLEELRTAEIEKARAASGGEEAAVSSAWVTDMQRFFNLFSDRKLALDVFTVIEDGRLDAQVRAEYLGIKTPYKRVQSDALESRPDVRTLPAREAMIELLVRLSLQQFKTVLVPAEHADKARKIARIARRVFAYGAEVEDTAEAVLRIYAIISPIANEEVPPEDWEEMEMDSEGNQGYADPEEMEELLQQVAEGEDMASRPEGEEEYESSEDVDYRGDFKPELAQLLEMLRRQSQEGQEQGAEEQITQEMVQEMLQQSAEVDMSEGQGEAQKIAGQVAMNMLKEAGIKEPQSPEHGQGPFVHVDEAGGPLDPSEPQTFVYDEWDFRADDYKPRWCIVRQKTMAEGDPAYYGATLHHYGPLVMQIRRQFEMMIPEMFRKEMRLQDGEDIDIDEVIEAFVDIRTGASPSEKLYWRRNKVQRDVSVVFLLDTSASTAEAIDETRRAADDWDAPDDPVEYMLWLRARRGEGTRRSYKRIIDLEKEALVLLINALEAIGDVYGIYGFSGYGRENVEFYTIKDIAERFSDRVKNRIDRISPLHATRMGPAIRHATTKLEAQDARTKLLFLISDGRPQDRGYSREGVEKEYAVHDTRMALEEAKRKEINAFCLTVDKNGHDYLKTMCQDMSYEVLDDIYTLPQRLLYLYKKLTM